jgi:hypothetical protein
MYDTIVPLSTRSMQPVSHVVLITPPAIATIIAIAAVSTTPDAIAVPCVPIPPSPTRSAMPTRAAVVHREVRARPRKHEVWLRAPPTHHIRARAETVTHDERDARHRAAGHSTHHACEVLAGKSPSLTPPISLIRTGRGNVLHEERWKPPLLADLDKMGPFRTLSNELFTNEVPGEGEKGEE